MAIYDDVSGASVGSSSAAADNIVRLRLPAGVSQGSATVMQPQISKFSLLSGLSVGSSFNKAYYTDKDIFALIKAILPEFLNDSKTIKSIQEAQGIESTRLFALVEQLILDYLIDTASDAGLAIREKELGVQSTGRTLTQRRVDLKLKQMPPELLTKSRFKGQLDNYHICKVEERPSDFKVVSTVLSRRGIPDDINDMIQTVERILPAHLVHEFIYTWLPWSEVREAKLTWGEARGFTWGELETAFLVPFDESQY